jgi:hypothetical protein
MAQNYAHLPAVVSAGFDWEDSLVYALLYEGAVFDPTHKRASQVGQWIKREPLQGRFVTDDGGWAGQPALFYMVAPEHTYQMVLGYDDGEHNELLLSFYDENTQGEPIQVARRGSLFGRPATEEIGTPPSYGIWLAPGLA